MSKITQSAKGESCTVRIVGYCNGNNETTVLAHLNGIRFKHGRQARLMELDPKYVDVIVKRLQEFTGKIAVHADTNTPFAEVTHGNEKEIN